MTDRTARIERAAADFIAVSLSLFPVLVLLRVYEYIVVRAAHAMPANAFALLANGLRADLSLTLWVSVVLALPLVALGTVAPRVARTLHRGLLVIIVAVSVVLVQYFAVTFIPLGADLFGYSAADITETARSSKGISVAAILPLLAFGVVAWLASGQAARVRMSRRGIATYAVTALVLIGVPPLLAVRPQNFTTDAEYFLASNKTGYFASRAFGHFAGADNAHGPVESFSGYPLLHAANRADVLGPMLNAAGRKPNIVVLIVEGLGRDFVGPGAHYGGFTPYLDSLIPHSLYWENFLSTSGRTFGVLPALLGSLPYGSGGFMEMGSRMPRHISLVSLLRDQGYTTSFFTGTDGHFDFIDTFMDREGTDRFVDQSKFGADYAKQPAGDGGFTWGYGDEDLFKRSLELIGPDASRPRLDVYLTITTHEPFIPPRTTQYHAEFERRLAALPVDDARKGEMRTYANVFSTLLYTDDALRSFMEAYARREDYGRTIFIITGDHRLIPIPTATRADRFHVPFIIFSSLLKAPARFSSVSSHADVTPTLVAYLGHNYGLTTPDSVSWLGTGIDTARQFRNVHDVPLMRAKNEVDEYLSGDRYLSGDQLFRLHADFTLEPLRSDAARDSVRSRLDHFRQLNEFVTSGDHLYPGGPAGTNPVDAARQDAVFKALGLVGKTPTDAFNVARDRAVKNDLDTARLIAEKLLRDAPNYHDARVLIGRTYAWQHRYPEAGAVFEALVHRAPEYADGHVAFVDLALFMGDGPRALARADSSLVLFPRDADLMFDRARALELLGRKPEALAALAAVERIDPAHDGLAAVKARLAR